MNSPNKISALFFLLITLLAVSASGQSTAQKSPETPLEWREQYAYIVGTQAFIYGFPAIYNTHLRYAYIAKPTGRVSMPVNTFFHVPNLATHQDKYGGSPNYDTIYSLAWVDLGKEPVIVTTPDTGARYYSVQLMEYYSDVFGYIGTRATGTTGGNYAVVGPNSKDKLPSGMKGVYRSPTPWALLLIRVDVASPEDLPSARVLQTATKLTPLSLWGKPNTKAPERRDVLAPANPQGDPLADFKTLNRAMTENPPPDRDRALIQQFATVGLGPGQSDQLENLDESTRRGLARAIVDARKFFRATAAAGGNTKVINGWYYGHRNWGRTAEVGDFLTRSAVQSFAGIVEHHIEECVKTRTFIDSDGKPLDGKNRYVIRFAADQIPKAKAFWSLTVYGPDFNLVETSINRYLISNRSKGLQYSKDGSLELYLQRESPGKEKVANWLPVSEGTFNLFFRAYLPEQELIEQRWIPPTVRRIE